jgi:predicted nuclease of predicted toxin-antitoxin system
MNFLFDENFPKAARAVLENAGHQVFDFRRLGVIGSPDEEIVKMAREKSAAILTMDRDFFHTLGRQYPEHHGIVVIALRQPTRFSIIGRLEWFLAQIDIEKLAGRTFQLRDRTWMVYPPL